MNDEFHLIKTLANESEKINTSDSFFIPSLKPECPDYSVTGWNDSKNITLASFFPIKAYQNKLQLRQSQNFTDITTVKFLNSPKSILRIKLKEKRFNSILSPRSSIYKVSNISLNDKPTNHNISKSVVRGPKIPRVHQNAFMSIYFPIKKSKKKFQKRNSQLAEINDLIEMLQPELKSPIKKTIISTLRSKIKLTNILSKKQLSKSPTNICQQTSHNNSVSIQAA